MPSAMDRYALEVTRHLHGGSTQTSVIKLNAANKDESLREMVSYQLSQPSDPTVAAYETKILILSPEEWEAIPEQKFDA